MESINCKLREMGADDLVEALRAQDDDMFAGLTFSERIQMAADEAHSSLVRCRSNSWSCAAVRPRPPSARSTGRRTGTPGWAAGSTLRRSWAGSCTAPSG